MISMTITEFKKFKASPDADKAKAADAQKQAGVRQNLSALRGGGSGSGKSKPAKLEDIDPTIGKRLQVSGRAGRQKGVRIKQYDNVRHFPEDRRLCGPQTPQAGCCE